jgi:cytochrome c biogenesis protein CcmG/thiol:disulfide interchange protein DsbE
LATVTEAQPRRRRGHLFLIPLVLFVAIGGFLALGLTRDPGTLPSTLIGKPAPSFSLPPVEGRDQAGFSQADLGGQPMLVNIFASWCVPCRIEHPVITRLAELGVSVNAINYKDDPAKATSFLKELGDPFRKVGADRTGRTAIEWGVYGVPETFVIDKQGNVAYKHVGPMQPRDLERTILPLLEKLK